MADPFVAEIRIFPFAFAPKGWAACDGQLLPISQNTALFALLGTTYGGNGLSTFALPDLRGSVAMHPGDGPGLSLYDLGQQGGTAALTLLPPEIPAHTHAVRASSEDGELKTPGPNRVLGRSVGGFAYQTSASPPVDMAADAIAPAGHGAPHNNLMPYLTTGFYIALQGIFPPRS